MSKGGNAILRWRTLGASKRIFDPTLNDYVIVKTIPVTKDISPTDLNQRESLYVCTYYTITRKDTSLQVPFNGRSHSHRSRWSFATSALSATF